MSTVATPGTEPIPGYALLERIGAGAYGEVWRAEAPGGLTKAIKIVYGFYNESRALRELKALQHVKQIRHPFLLSLERFEIVEGRLVIVSELADMSLRDRFHACREAGAAGIGREELLNHLRDAADALDYINETQSLQHLDVKPENLLLVGGRLKLADFGLVQSLLEGDASFLDGMTPRYAAPEIFKGRPTKYSDQFSLAVLYAELLTGESPFDAKSSADIAVQHLIGAKPKLDRLPAEDQAVVARALSRKSDDRFPNCRAFVDHLVPGPGEGATGAASRKGASLAPAGASDAARPHPSPTADDGNQHAGPRRDSMPVGDELTVVLFGESGIHRPERLQNDTSRVRRLPAREFEPCAWEGRPTLFVGVGGAATQVLGRLRKRLEERFLFPDRIPAWRMLLIDTDQNSLDSMSGSDVGGNRSTCDTLLLKLRTTQEYRDGSPQLLKWLSRRWLYNIARVPRTSGWRPLGRLALVDHGPAVMDRLRRALEEVTASDALACSVDTVNAEFSAKPLIVLVASISGGSGSGMVLDLAYAIRKLTAELEIGDYALRGVLLHATDSDPESQDLARANAFACLTELAHFNRPGGGYPGEESLNLPAFPSICPTFDETFVAHLGDDLLQPEYLDQVERVSDYLYYGLATRAGTLLDSTAASDDPDWASPKGTLAVHTFGLYAVNNLRREEVDAFVDRVCQAVVEKWIGTEDTLSETALNGRPAVAGGEGLVTQLKKLVDEAFGPQADQSLLRELTKSLQDHVQKLAGVSSENQQRTAAAQIASALSGVSVELSELARSLRAVRGAGAVCPDGDMAEETLPEKTPLASIRSTVHSFLNERVAELADDLARDFPRLFLRRERRASDADDRAGQTLNGFCRHLRMTARAGILQAVKQVDVSRLLLEMTGKSRAAREPMRQLLAAAQPRLFVTDAAERLFIFAPGYSNCAALRGFFKDDLHEEATIVPTEDDRLTLYFERAQLNLTNVAAAMVDENFRYAEMAARLHTRVDVAWASLRPARQEEPRDAQPAS